MRIMQGPSREDTHWGQCFEEFYGPEYCKNLRKDLEKLKDEFYDGNPLRFQREWVMPTAGLLRRMRHMSFPLRTREFVYIHLYNPVDSMCPGEMHLQVGRKIPGTLTLKFTKQNTGGTFVIQPKTLSGADEQRLSEDPVRYFEEVRREMRDSSMDSSSQLTTIVLMTDFCKLERKNLKEFLMSMGRTEIPTPLPPSNAFPEVAPSCPPTSAIPFNSGHWAALNVPNAFNPESMTRPDANFPFPWNFCVKNYVSYNGRDGKPTTEMGVSMHNPVQGIASTATYPTGLYTNIGNVFRQSRSSNWHSEPEENDETMNMLSMNEQQWNKMNRTPAHGVEEIQRRMSDSKLWDAPKAPPTGRPRDSPPTPSGGDSGTFYPIPSTSAITHPPPSKSNTQHHPTNVFNRAVNPDRSRPVAGPGDARTTVTEEYAVENQASPEILINDEIPNGRESHAPLRRDSDTRTSLTDQYVTECTSPSTTTTTNNNSYGLCCPTPDIPRDPSDRRTSYTEVYAGDSHGSGSSNSGKNPFSGAFSDAVATATNRTATRATVTENYAGDQSPQSRIQPMANDHDSFRQRASSSSYLLSVNAHRYSESNAGKAFDHDSKDEMDDSRPRTSSLDAYVGEAPPPSSTTHAWQGGIFKAHSTGDVNRSNQLWANQRTTAVDEYLGGGGGGGQNGVSAMGESCQTRLGVRFQSPAASIGGSTTSGDSEVTNGFDSVDGFDSWGSHCPEVVAARGHYVYNQARSLVGGRLGSLRMAESSDENDMSLLSHTSFPSWGSHHCGTTIGYNRVLIPLTVEEYNRSLIHDGGGSGGGGAGPARQPFMSSDS